MDSKLLSALKAQRLSGLSDMTIIIKLENGDVLRNVHGCVMSSISSVVHAKFQAWLLSGDRKAGQMFQLSLRLQQPENVDLYCEVLDLLISYAYGDEVMVTEEHAVLLQTLAQVMQVDVLLKVCMEVLKPPDPEGSYTSIRQAADKDKFMQEDTYDIDSQNTGAQDLIAPLDENLGEMACHPYYDRVGSQRMFDTHRRGPVVPYGTAKRVVNGERELYCLVCDYSRPNEVYVMTHVNERHIPFTCLHCGYEFALNNLYLIHLEKQHGNTPGSRQCGVCEETFEDYGAYVRHGCESRPCPRRGCDFIGLNEFQMEEHLNEHRGKPRSLCEPCKLLYADPRSFEIHSRQHREHKRFNNFTDKASTVLGGSQSCRSSHVSSEKRPSHVSSEKRPSHISNEKRSSHVSQSHVSSEKRPSHVSNEKRSSHVNQSHVSSEKRQVEMFQLRGVMRDCNRQWKHAAEDERPALDALRKEASRRRQELQRRERRRVKRSGKGRGKGQKVHGSTSQDVGESATSGDVNESTLGDLNYSEGYDGSHVRECDSHRDGESQPTPSQPEDKISESTMLFLNAEVCRYNEKLREAREEERPALEALLKDAKQRQAMARGRYRRQRQAAKKLYYTQ